MSKGITRREALVAAGVVGAGAVGIAATVGEPAADARAEGPGQKAGGGARMPVAYLPHGGGPWPFVDLGMPQKELDDLSGYLRSVRALPKTPPRALLVISAHWEEAVPTLMTSAAPPLLFDYHGFPPASYELTWPAPGAPALAAQVAALLEDAGIPSGRDEKRGFDHGTFVPLKLTYPEAEVPTLQLSLKKGLDPAEHLRIGRALAPLRDEGVFIVGSGMSFHNMRAFRDPRGATIAATFDAWLRESCTLPQSERDARLTAWATAPSGRMAHPREEHLLPLMVVAGAAGADVGTVAFQGNVLGVAVSGYHFG